jgi:exosortase F-associated protein
MNPIKIRLLLGIVSVVSLFLVFLFPIQNLATLLVAEDGIARFIVGRSIRLIVNDGLAILLVFALFHERKYVLFACWVQLFGFALIVIPYFIIKLNYPGYNGPLISFLHRLTLNPTLILLLIPVFYYQRKINLNR